MKILQVFIRKLERPTGEKKAYDVDFSKIHPAYILASWFWSGRLRPAAGTWGTLAALPFWWLVFQSGSLWFVLATLLVLFILGSLAIEYIEKTVGKDKCHDASVFVVDEVVGMGITLLPIAYFGTAFFPVWAWWLYAFLAFRFFDVVKLFPARLIDCRMHNGWGVMLDDVVAGVHGAIAALTLIFTVSTWQICVASGQCIGSDGELFILFLLHAVPALCFFASLIAVPWLLGFFYKKKK
ncbi:MAG: phosphatidylglycerophosphatase A [Alphaproteobacteria bacterium]|nr:phosphatidylglycerophosphatase A [Alphaproteobacteria bacterium]MDD9920195.1 phosphatidylglycerophosphatase A [Alphaproteobacteria bacterium]